MLTPSDLGVGVFGESSEGLHERLGHLTLLRGQLRPRGHALGPRRQLGVVGNNAQLLLSRQGDVTLLVPSVLEAPPVLLPPRWRHVQGRMTCTGCEIQEERPLVLEAPMQLDPAGRVVDQVLGQVIRALRVPGRFDRTCSVVQQGVPVIHFGTHEPIEMIEPLVRRPPVKRAERAHLMRWSLVPLANRGGGISVPAQDLGESRRRRRAPRAIARIVASHLRDEAHSDRMMVSSGQKRLTGRCAQATHVEPGVTHALRCEPFRMWRLARATKHAGAAKPDVIQQDEKNIRAIDLGPARIHVAHSRPPLSTQGSWTGRWWGAGRLLQRSDDSSSVKAGHTTGSCPGTRR